MRALDRIIASTDLQERKKEKKRHITNIEAHLHLRLLNLFLERIH